VKGRDSILPRLLLAGLLLLPLAPAAPAAAEAPAEAAMHAKVFTIRWRSAGDAALIVEPLLSASGSYTLRPKLQTITVSDSEAVLARVAEALQQFDVPPRSVTLTINLLMGTRGPVAEQSLPAEVRGITDALQDVTRWQGYRLLDSVAVAGTEGGTITRTLAGEEGQRDQYRIRLGIETVDGDRGLIRVNPFVIERVDSAPPSPQAVSAPAVWRTFYTTKLTLRNDRILTIGASRTEKSDKAVFLTIRARVAE